MAETLTFLEQHGVLVLFLVTLLDQVGLPLPGSLCGYHSRRLAGSFPPPRCREKPHLPPANHGFRS